MHHGGYLHYADNLVYMVREVCQSFNFPDGHFVPRGSLLLLFWPSGVKKKKYIIYDHIINDFEYLTSTLSKNCLNYCKGSKKQTCTLSSSQYYIIFHGFSKHSQMLI